MSERTPRGLFTLTYTRAVGGAQRLPSTASLHGLRIDLDAEFGHSMAVDLDAPGSDHLSHYAGCLPRCAITLCSRSSAIVTASPIPARQQYYRPRALPTLPAVSVSKASLLQSGLSYGT